MKSPSNRSLGERLESHGLGTALVPISSHRNALTTAGLSWDWPATQQIEAVPQNHRVERQQQPILPFERPVGLLQSDSQARSATTEMVPAPTVPAGAISLGKVTTSAHTGAPVATSTATVPADAGAVGPQVATGTGQPDAGRTSAPSKAILPAVVIVAGNDESNARPIADPTRDAFEAAEGLDGSQQWVGFGVGMLSGVACGWGLLLVAFTAMTTVPPQPTVASINFTGNVRLDSVALPLSGRSNVGSAGNAVTAAMLVPQAPPATGAIADPFGSAQGGAVTRSPGERSAGRVGEIAATKTILSSLPAVGDAKPSLPTRATGGSLTGEGALEPGSRAAGHVRQDAKRKEEKTPREKIAAHQHPLHGAPALALAIGSAAATEVAAGPIPPPLPERGLRTGIGMKLQAPTGGTSGTTFVKREDRPRTVRPPLRQAQKSQRWSGNSSQLGSNVRTAAIASRRSAAGLPVAASQPSSPPPGLLQPTIRPDWARRAFQSTD